MRWLLLDGPSQAALVSRVRLDVREGRWREVDQRIRGRAGRRDRSRRLRRGGRRSRALGLLPGQEEQLEHVRINSSHHSVLFKGYLIVASKENMIETRNAVSSQN
jgi:hypothetical protein